MIRLYQSLYRTTAKYEAQAHLQGKTHYVDDETLRFHHSRVLQCDISHGGLLCWIIESVALDMHNTQRGFRYVVFDVFGNVIKSAPLENCVKTSKQAKKLLRAYLDTVDAMGITKQAITDRKKNDARDYGYLQEQLTRIKVTA